MNEQDEIITPSITYAELARVHEELDQLLWRSAQESSRRALVIALGRKVEQMMGKGKEQDRTKLQSFIFPTRAGWAAQRKPFT